MRSGKVSPLGSFYVSQTLLLYCFEVSIALARKQIKFGALQTDVSKAHEVRIYFESLCPDTVSFFQQQVAKIHRNVDLRKNFNFSLYPYGNVHRDTGDATGKSWGGRLCQHGDRECFGNAWMACSQVVLGKLRSMDHTLCLLDLPKHGMPQKYWKSDAWSCGDYKECVVDRCDRIMNEQEKNSIADCVGQLRGNATSSTLATLEKATKDETVTHVPWVVVNGQHRVAFDDLKANLIDLLEQSPTIVDDDTRQRRMRGTIVAAVCIASIIVMCLLRHVWSSKFANQRFQKLPSLSQTNLPSA